MAERGVKLKYIEMYISKDGKIAIKDGGTAKTAEETEKHVMQWAAEHPEPRYPTWKEWQDTNFPNNDALMRPCIFESEEYFNCKQENGCEKCMNKPIPADIAEKLHIEPIGDELNGKADPV